MPDAASGRPGARKDDHKLLMMAMAGSFQATAIHTLSFSTDYIVHSWMVVGTKECGAIEDPHHLEKHQTFSVRGG